ncbi:MULTISPECIES: hypothetical protein [unclassified Mesorhizobium]|uniref:hypothetical protein n=1 Tax=unclassified Mesorhizobium TaxID=325217 RepID=UPI003337DA79
MSGPYEMSFANAVRKAVIGDATALKALLQSDAELGQSERALLADLIDELASRPQVQGRGRPKGDRFDGNTQRQAVQRYRSLVASGEAAKNAAIDVANSLNVSKSTLLAWNTEISTIEQQMKQLGLPNWQFADWGSVLEK